MWHHRCNRLVFVATSKPNYSDKLLSSCTRPWGMDYPSTLSMELVDAAIVCRANLDPIEKICYVCAPLPKRLC